jgi:hypothetical protein
MIKEIQIIFICATMLLFTGCASVFSGSNQNLSFDSEPSGAQVTMNSASLGKTPLTIPVKKKLSAPIIEFKLDGYETKSLALQNAFDPIGVLNIFIWPGFIIDAATGSMMEYDVYNYKVILDKK